MNKAEERAKYLGYGTDPLNRAEYTANEVRDAFIDGYKDAVEKAVEWLYQRQVVDLEVSDIEKFVNEFKKAMKGGEG